MATVTRTKTTVKTRPVRKRHARRNGTRRSQASGRPRDARIDSEVVAAVLSALKAGGYLAVTIDSIARRVGRARSSIYRRWPSKSHLVAYTVVNVMGREPADDTGSVRGDLEAAVGTLLHAFVGPLGSALAGLVADMAQDLALRKSIQQKVLTPRRRSMREALERGQIRGEVRRDLDVELVLDMLIGPFYFRRLFGHLPITQRTVGSIVDYVLLMIQAPVVITD
jgi:AcrR family transcriptional regulator